jgi:MoaA/NifB/PqqE/SkfB family radical SAM enzyme
MTQAIAAGRAFGRRLWGELIAHPLWRRMVTSQFWLAIRMTLSDPPWEGAVLTPRRRFNLYLQRLEHRVGRVKLWSKPCKLTVEATNICNLRCPGCFTGTSQDGRARSHMSLELYNQLMEELGPYLLEVEFYNWGEPLLGKNIYPMVEAAASRGISTTVSTNFSIPFSDEDAERLVRTGLTILGVSIDGARQETYEQYRVRGDLQLVLDNCRKVRDAKRRLGAQKPRMVWEFHAFPHNVDDVARARELAAELEMDISVSTGWVVDSDWDGGGVTDWPMVPAPWRCPFLWGATVVNNDGGVAPCCGTFYREDDCAQMATTPGGPGAKRFAEVWNNESLMLARRFYNNRQGTPEEREHVCYDCPMTVMFEDYQKHLRAGGNWLNYTVPIKNNSAYNYFWHRRPPRSLAPAARRAR